MHHVITTFCRAIQGIIKIDSQTPAEFKSFGREKKSELYGIASRMPSQVKNEIEDALEVSVSQPLSFICSLSKVSGGETLRVPNDTCYANFNASAATAAART